MLRSKEIGIVILATGVFTSALAVVYCKHQSRYLCTQLQNLQQTVEALQVEWGQLLLEQGTWSQDARIEKIAKERMQMSLPEPGTVVVIDKG